MFGVTCLCTETGEMSGRVVVGGGAIRRGAFFSSSSSSSLMIMELKIGLFCHRFVRLSLSLSLRFCHHQKFSSWTPIIWSFFPSSSSPDHLTSQLKVINISLQRQFYYVGDWRVEIATFFLEHATHSAGVSDVWSGSASASMAVLPDFFLKAGYQAEHFTKMSNYFFFKCAFIKKAFCLNYYTCLAFQRMPFGSAVRWRHQQNGPSKGRRENKLFLFFRLKAFEEFGREFWGSCGFCD